MRYIIRKPVKWQTTNELHEESPFFLTIYLPLFIHVHGFNPNTDDCFSGDQMDQKVYSIKFEGKKKKIGTEALTKLATKTHFNFTICCSSTDWLTLPRKKKTRFFLIVESNVCFTTNNSSSMRTKTINR